MIMSINQRLRSAARERNSLVCVGLDTNPAQLPDHLKKYDDAVFEFNKQIIEATSDLVLAYKPNLAFYEALGVKGWDILRRTVEAVPEGVIKIGDAKRGDIGSTAARYAKALFDMGFDMITVNPYLGFDSVDPFLQDTEKGVFLLCLTSNPGSKDFQYLNCQGKPLYQHIAQKIYEWNSRDNCGLVVGATHPDELKEIRHITPDLPFLIPGIGAQGGDLESAIQHGTDDHGNSAVINSSRGIIYASSGEDFAEAARAKTIELRDAINQVRTLKE
jgi:orotidine-5'-phosphate decarboxylase